MNLLRSSELHIWLAVLLICLTSVSCQQYTSGVQQSLARADEAVVISYLRAISLAQQAYSGSNAGGYGTLEHLTKGGYLDGRFSMNKPIRDYVLDLKVTRQPAVTRARPTPIEQVAARDVISLSAPPRARFMSTPINKLLRLTKF